MARAALGWTARDVAEKAQVGRATVQRIEAGLSEPRPAIAAAIRRAFETAGVEFKPDGSVRLREQPAEAS